MVHGLVLLQQKREVQKDYNYELIYWNLCKTGVEDNRDRDLIQRNQKELNLSKAEGTIYLGSPATL